MSTSACRSKVGTVARELAIRRAISCCALVSSRTCVSPFELGAGVEFGGGDACRSSSFERTSERSRSDPLGSGRGAVDGGADDARTSALRIRPRGPLPVIEESSIPRPSATRRATGEALITVVLSPPEIAALLVCVAESSAFATDPGGEAVPSPGASPPIVAIGLPTVTVCCSATRIVSVPAKSASNVIVALSVSISTRSAPRSTHSPL